MANSLLTINMITREAVTLWKNTNAFMMSINTQYDDYYAVDGAKIGDTLRIRLPNDYTVRTGAAASVQDTAEQQITLSLATQKGVDVSFSTRERTMSLDDYSERVLAPMINNLAGATAADIMSGVESGVSNIVANQDGALNIITPNSGTYLLAGAALANNSAPMANRRIINSPNTEARVVQSLSGLLNPTKEISDQYATGEMYRALGFKWAHDQTTLMHTTGTMALNTDTVSGANQSGTTITVNAMAGTLKKGDIITFENVNQVNRITKADVGTLAQFVVLADVAVGGTSISIYPALIPPSGGSQVQYQTVTQSPANGAKINPALSLAASTTYRKNIAFSPEAVTMVTADLMMPKGVHEAAREQFDGVSMRMVTDYIFGTDQLATRLDILYGFLYVRPEWAVVVCDNA